ncbi:TetR/AcrR family transcriptional regulator [Amycolatopsis sp. 195334CR]|uniref:TetR/AcrR family transcriptional regulator n=1 Tax=Amycolatopsis sp. 195334CR TaxID=2814588 RepID=UPI001A8CCC70|nr:TetR/AcrR family transcriptional regulator [Amycolatopsis sp. 195334CR]MBN6038281.1 TetR/AcrR family transcriptional regulator [Amycolatopsis sp. 195334CR]
MSRARNRRGEGVRLRTEILAAAIALLDRGDQRAVTLRAVARAAGITAPSIYPHFPDQPAILHAVAVSASAELAHRLGTAIGTAGEDTRQRLFAACRAYLEFATTHPQLYRILFDPARGPADPGRPVLRLLAVALADCATAGQSGSTDPAADAVALWLGLHGLADQLTVQSVFPWPADLVPHLVSALARL